MQNPICIFALICLSVNSPSTKATVIQQEVVFKQQSFCPANATLPLIRKLGDAQSPNTCFTECARQLNCSVLHRSNGICFFGNSTQLSQLFNQTDSLSSDPCVSYVRQNVTSKLVVLFDFRQGYSNLISPGIFDATPHGSVNRSSIYGAYFPGRSSDFIEVDTQNGSLISTYLSFNRRFSYYARVFRQSVYQQNYHYFYDCLSNASAGCFGDRDKYAWIEQQFSGLSGWTDAKETRQSIATLFSSQQAVTPVSLGAVFYGNTLTSFYFNGTEMPAGSDLAWGLGPQPRCLRLGFDLVTDVPLNGRMICYAIAKSALSTADFQQLDKMCN